LTASSTTTEDAGFLSVALTYWRPILGMGHSTQMSISISIFLCLECSFLPPLLELPTINFKEQPGLFFAPLNAHHLSNVLQKKTHTESRKPEYFVKKTRLQKH
jgi:hypothetical protein